MGSQVVSLRQTTIDSSVEWSIMLRNPNRRAQMPGECNTTESGFSRIRESCTRVLPKFMNSIPCSCIRGILDVGCKSPVISKRREQLNHAERKKSLLRRNGKVVALQFDSEWNMFKKMNGTYSKWCTIPKSQLFSEYNSPKNSAPKHSSILCYKRVTALQISPAKTLKGNISPMSGVGSIKRTISLNGIKNCGLDSATALLFSSYIVRTQYSKLSSSTITPEHFRAMEQEMAKMKVALQEALRLRQQEQQILAAENESFALYKVEKKKLQEKLDVANIELSGSSSKQLAERKLMNR